MERGDSVLAGASLVIAVLAGVAGAVLLFAAGRLDGYFGIPGEPREHEWAAALVILVMAIFCFFEAYRFYRFFASPEIRDRYYAKRLRKRADPKVKG
jgi:phosphotransferase system  glucose/maltose/N-acetylglucosamine-specific IIC component